MNAAAYILNLLKQGEKKGLQLLFKKYSRPLVLYACLLYTSSQHENKTDKYPQYPDTNVSMHSAYKWEDIKKRESPKR